MHRFVNLFAPEALLLLSRREVSSSPSTRPVSTHPGKASAFTLVETLVSTTIIILLSLSVVPAMLHMNTNATVARLTTLASIIALNQVELVATDAPFSPPDGQIPVELASGQQTAPVIIYDDPNWDHSVLGQMTTKVEDPDYWQNGVNLHLRKVTVTVSYRFRNKDYSVVMHTIRASDV